MNDESKKVEVRFDDDDGEFEVKVSPLEDVLLVSADQGNELLLIGELARLAKGGGFKEMENIVIVDQEAHRINKAFLIERGLSDGLVLAGRNFFEEAALIAEMIKIPDISIDMKKKKCVCGNGGKRDSCPKSGDRGYGKLAKPRWRLRSFRRTP